MPRVGDVYGCLTVTKVNSYQSKNGGRYSECLCECGRVLNVSNCLLLGSGSQQVRKSCGKQHRQSHSLTFESWRCMIYRCQNPKHRSYQNYGGRGIKVCQRWNKSFLNFLADMGERPSKDYSLDRIDNNGDYEPSNCRWATSVEQSNNTRANHFIAYQDKTQTLKQWANELNINYTTLFTRIKRGWTVEKAFTK